VKPLSLASTFRRRRPAGFTIIEVLMSLGILSITIAAVVPRLTSTKRQAIATAVVNDLRTFAAAFDTYAQEKGGYPAETAAGELPTEMKDRINNTAWLRQTPIGGQYNWDNNQLHTGTRYKAVIQISETAAAPLPQDLDLWEAIDRVIDDGNLNTGNFRLGANDEPIFIISP
jgi:prepilin-type N-terminal cleavage/methylation domain-containing protein